MDRLFSLRTTPAGWVAEKPRRRRIHAPLILWLLLVTSAAAEGSSPVIFEHIESRDGLSHNSVGPILQDRRGFLWIGTLDGLNRFDGLDFTTWHHDSTDPKSLASNNVSALLEDRQGVLWVGTDRGLDRFERFGPDGGTFHHVAVQGPKPLSSSVRTLYEDRDGGLWAGLTAGLLRRSGAGDSFELLRHDPLDPRSLAAGEVWDIQQDPAGALWIFTALGLEFQERHGTLNRFDPNTNSFDRFPAPPTWDARGFLIDRAGIFWLNTSGLATFDPATSQFQGPVLSQGYQPLHGLWPDDDGAIWIATAHGFLRYQPASGEVSEPFPSAARTDRLAGFAGFFARDRSGTRWLGTRGGLFKWDQHRKPFHHRHRQARSDRRLDSDLVSSVHVDKLGSHWVGTFGAGLNRFEDLEGPAISYRHRAGDSTSLCNDNIWHLAEDGQGDLWLGVDGGLCRYTRSTDRFSSVPLEVPGVSGGVGSIRFIVVAASGKLWLASEVGLLSLAPKTGDLRRPGGSEAGRPGTGLIHSLLLEEGKSLWLGIQGGGLEELDLVSGSLRRHPLVIETGKLRSEGIFAIHPSGDGSLWLGSGAGLSRYDPANGEVVQYEARDGLPGSSVFSILEDDDERLWLGTNQGLSCFDPRLPAGSGFRNFNLLEGAGSLEFNRHAAHRGRDGRLFFGGMNGLTSFLPREIQDNPVIPPVALTSVRIWNRDGETAFDPGDMREIVLSPQQSSFAFEFAALNFTNASRNRYAYRLEGFDDGWVDNGTRRFARYHRVPPGRYQFRVKGSNNDGHWNSEGAVLGVRILPPFWQTWWFRLALLVAGAAALIAAHRFRVARLLEIEKLRTRIAGDLHDDLSSELSGVALAMEVLQQTEADAGHRRRLAQVRESSLRMLDGLRDIVWCVNPEHDNRSALLRRMRSVARTLLVGRSYHFETSDFTDGDLPLAVRRNLLLIYKEALHNALRHSRAHRVQITLSSEGRDLVLGVVDDGIGFDTETSHAGHGLASMHRRAAEMGARLRIVSQPGEGTEIHLRVPDRPQRRARAKRPSWRRRESARERIG